jgi:uncharacterized delta-60 repeat protein
MKTTRKSFPLFNLGLLLSLQLLLGSTLFSYFRSCESTIARLNADGSIDTSFVADGSFKGDFYAYKVVPLADGKMLVVGGFSEYGGVKCVAIARLNADGSLDTGYIPGETLSKGRKDEIVIWDLILQPDGLMLIIGLFSYFENDTSLQQLARLHPDGSLDTSFKLGRPTDAADSGETAIATSMALQPDGKVVVGGDFLRYNGVTCSNIIRLLPNGSVDAGFRSGSGFNESVNKIVSQPDGKILVGGNFNSYNGISCGNLVRLNTDGSLDSTFRPDTIYTCSTSEIVLLSDGKILVNPSYPVTSGEDSISRQLMRLYRDQLFRLNQDGSLDEGFYVGEGAKIGKYGWPSIYDVVVQQDGKLLVVGSFDSYNGVDCYGMLRLQTNGSLDSTFSVTEPVIYSSGKIALQPDGKIILLKAIERK